MTTYDDQPDVKQGKLTLAEILEVFASGNQLPLKFTAYDGSSAGPDDAELGLELRSPRGTTYLATAPGDLGMARAYVSGDLETHGVHPGDPYELLRTLSKDLDFKRPPTRVLAQIVRSIGLERLKPIAPPPQEAIPKMASNGGRVAAQQDPGCRGHPSPLRRLECVLRAGARPVDDLHLRVLPDTGRDPRGGAGQQVPVGVREAAPEGRRPPARRRLWLGRNGSLRGAPRRADDRRHAVGGAGRMGAEGDRRRGAVGIRRGAARRLSRHPRDEVRRRLVDRAHRAHRSGQLSGLFPLPAIADAHRRAAAEPLHHPARQSQRRRGGRVHRPLRVPGRRTDRIRAHHHRGPERRSGSGARGEPAQPLRHDAARLVPQPRRPLG